MVKYKIGDALKKGIALLNENSIETPALDARILLCHVLGCDSLYLTVERDKDMTPSDLDTYMQLVGRRSRNEPISYIIGKKEFMSLEFGVNPSVLIPRPDTEILVERAINQLENVPSPVVVDMCTGSGAIAVSVAKYLPSSRVTALDISENALATARENAFRNQVDVSFELHDVLTPYKGLMADAVLSNPPYIPTEDVEGLEVNVSCYEPHLALDGGADGLVFYRAITKNVSSCLKRGGMLAFEVGMGQAEDVANMMSPLFEGISTEKDLAGIERVVYGFLK